MYSLLIVDDEVHAVKGIESAIDWEKLQVTSLYTAYNIRQAKEVYDNHSIDIMLCDIEMPQGSGLELLTWVREHHPHVESVFLTCHADFEYAKQAMQLGSLDYILKPIPYAELEKVIVKAINKINTNNELTEFSRYGQYWFQQQPLLTEQFWLDILNQTISSNEAAIRKAAADRNLPYLEGARYLPVLISIQRWHKYLSVRDEKIMEFALRNAANESILEQGKIGHLIQCGKGKLIALISVEIGVDLDLPAIRAVCASYISTCNTYFYCDLSCYVGNMVHAHELSAMADKLAAAERDNVALDNKVFVLDGRFPSSNTFNMPNMSVWAVLLKDGETDKLISKIAGYLDDQVRADCLDANLLHQFHQDLLQMVYSIFQMKGIRAHQLLNDSVSMELSQQATRSLMDMLVWIKHILWKSTEYAKTVEETQTVVDRVIAYIELNKNKELLREDIANHVFLNPDYLTRIFKKETGLGIFEYILRERLNLAENLLLHSEMSVSAVAAHVGYSNFSHFSRIFKKHTGKNPLDYRHTGASESASE